MRLLILDESRLLAWMVEQLCPAGTEILGLESFEDARRAVKEHAPDAAVVNLGQAHLPWREFQKLCASRNPPVPVLFESSVFTSAQEAGLDPAGGRALFLHTPAPVAEFGDALVRLLEDAREAGRQLAHPETEAKSA